MHVNENREEVENKGLERYLLDYRENMDERREEPDENKRIKVKGVRKFL